jgi:hypothetical protein
VFRLTTIESEGEEITLAEVLVPIVTIEITDNVARVLDRQARALLLGRREYIRALLASVAAQAERELATSKADAPAAR